MAMPRTMKMKNRNHKKSKKTYFMFVFLQHVSKRNYFTLKNGSTTLLN